MKLKISSASSVILEQFSGWTRILILGKETNSTGMLCLGSFLLLSRSKFSCMEYRYFVHQTYIKTSAD